LKKNLEQKKIPKAQEQQGFGTLFLTRGAGKIVEKARAAGVLELKKESEGRNL